MIALVRLSIFLLRRRWGLIIVGALLTIGGLIWGLTSHQVSYVHSDKNATYSVGQGETSGNTYIHIKGSDDYYAAFSGDFSPPIAQSDIDNSVSLSFIARTDTSSLNPSLNAPDGTTIDNAHKIEQLVFYDKDGKVLSTYTTAEYQANPNGFYANEWLKAIWLVLIGLLIGGAAIIVPMLAKPKPQANAGFNMGAAGMMQPYQGPNSYDQAYQPPSQNMPYQPQQPPYQQPGQYPSATPYPPQQPAYGQPPYQQPGQYPPATPYPPQQPAYGQPPYQQPPHAPQE